MEFPRRIHQMEQHDLSRSKKRVLCSIGLTTEFLTKVGVRQGSVRSLSTAIIRSDGRYNQKAAP